MSDLETVVHIYDSQSGAEKAIQRLQESGYNVKSLSILYRDYRVEQRVVGFFTTGDRVCRWGRCGFLWGALAGLTFGVVSSVLSGSGAASLVDPVSLWIEGALGGAIGIGGLSAMIASLYSVSSTKSPLVKYEVAVASDNEFVLVSRATAADVAVAREILEALNPGKSGMDASGCLGQFPSCATGRRVASA